MRNLFVLILLAGFILYPASSAHADGRGGGTVVLLGNAAILIQ